MVLCAILLLVLLLTTAVECKRDFKIDYENNQFLKDGQPFRYISGSIHYSRVPYYYWKDRLMKMKAGGLNAIQFYVSWNVHEPYPGVYNWKGNANLTDFFELANQLDLIIILRAGPYTCGEWDSGGLPWWLMKRPNQNIKKRTSDPKFLTPVANWYKVFFPKILPYLYKNGGPIALIQVENEYGSMFNCDDITYRAYLRDLIRSYVGYDQELITDDGGTLGFLKCGYIPGVYPTIDFGTGDKAGVAKAFAAQRAYAPRGPLVNTEFYPGWLDTWGQDFPRANLEAASEGLLFEGPGKSHWGDSRLIIYRLGKISNTSLEIGAVKGHSLQILVENRGRQSSGMNDFKGITSNVTLDGQILRNWTCYLIDLTRVHTLLQRRNIALTRKIRSMSLRNLLNNWKLRDIPAIYYGKFSVASRSIGDTYFDPTGWGKGQFFLNKNNVGRYWPSLGPQVTLYTPKGFVNTTNHVLMFELESPGNCDANLAITCTVHFTDKPFLNATVTPGPGVGRETMGVHGPHGILV